MALDSGSRMETKYLASEQPSIWAASLSSAGMLPMKVRVTTMLYTDTAPGGSSAQRVLMMPRERSSAGRSG